jgi:hypothetical protein
VDFPREGIRHQFSGLSGRGTVTFGYLKQKAYMAVDLLVLLGTILAGVIWARSRPKAHFFLGAALGAIILSSFTSAAVAGWLDSVFWGAVLVGLWWVAPDCVRRVRETGRRFREWRAERRRRRQEQKAAADALRARRGEDPWSRPASAPKPSEGTAKADDEETPGDAAKRGGPKNA